MLKNLKTFNIKHFQEKCYYLKVCKISNTWQNRDISCKKSYSYVSQVSQFNLWYISFETLCTRCSFQQLQLAVGWMSECFLDILLNFVRWENVKLFWDSRKKYVNCKICFWFLFVLRQDLFTAKLTWNTALQ